MAIPSPLAPRNVRFRPTAALGQPGARLGGHIGSMSKIVTITDVAERQLCTGCGACAYVQPNEIHMVDDIDHGRRPIVAAAANRPGGTDDALSACPGIELGHGNLPDDAIKSLVDSWGPVLEVWEGYAADEIIRFRASSGGVSSALAIFGIAQRNMAGLLHVRARTDRPYLNETAMSRTRAEILRAVGSRYAPASPCDGLGMVESADAPVIMIGKPCDIAGAMKAERIRPRLRKRLGLTIAIFCAGTPTLRGTFEMLQAMGVCDPDAIKELRYRGYGWPGGATAVVKGDNGSTTNVSMTYEQSWGEILQRHRQWRCYVCADHTGEFADLAVGDPWYRPPEHDEPGRSLIIIRTARGRDFFRAALAAGAVHAEPRLADTLPAAQPWLGRVRGEAGARVATLRLLGIPAPSYRNMPVWPAWLRNLTFRDKLRSTIGTILRLKRKGLWHRHPVEPWEPHVEPHRKDLPGPEYSRRI